MWSVATSHDFFLIFFMMYASLGFGLTCLLQASTTNRLSTLYLADIVDGVSSCMSGVCQAYVADASDPASRAINLGIFQGISIAGAFIVGIPISAILSQKVGLRAPVYLAAAVQVLNFGLIALVTPESNPASARKGRRLNLREANEPLSSHMSHPIPRISHRCNSSSLSLFRRTRSGRSDCYLAVRRCSVAPRAPTASSGSPTAASTRSSMTTSTIDSVGGPRRRDHSSWSSG